jgi:hypothetical protein
MMLPPGPTAPHASEIQALIETFYKELEPYRQERSNVAQDMYANLPLPWTLLPAISGFSESSFQRTVFSEENGNQIAPSRKITLAQGERMYGSGSPIVRWREKHPELAGSGQDIVKVCFKKIGEILGNADAPLDVDTRLVLLLWRKEE